MKISDHSHVAAAVATAGVVGGVYAAYQGYKKYKTTRIPQVWKKVGTLKDIYIYPIKSCGGVALERAECSILGLKHGWLRDRILMVTDNKNNFTTARVYPKLLTVSPSVKGSILTLRYGNMEPLRVNLAEIIEQGTAPKMAQVWNVTVPVYDCGLEASEWLSRCLDQPDGFFRLAYYASQKSRELKFSTKYYKYTKNDTGALPDEVPFSLINEASVEDLQQKINGDKVSVRNFRHNFVLEGAEAFEEDNYKFVKIGENIFEIIKPCTRCLLTTIDPETGVRDKNSKILETLNSYRQIVDPEERRAVGNSPRMGIQMALRSGPGGIVTRNEPIYFG